MKCSFNPCKIEIEQVKISSQKLAILRHDMRHHLSIILTQLQNGHPDKAQEYIHEINSAYDDTIIAAYSGNEMLNSVLSIYHSRFADRGLSLICNVSTGKELPCSDLSFCTILSNALEQLESPSKWARLTLSQKKESHSFPTGKSRRKDSDICRWSSGFYQKRAWNRCQEYYLLCGTITLDSVIFLSWTIALSCELSSDTGFSLPDTIHTFIHRKVLIKIMNIAICDDEILFTRELSSLLTHWAKKIDFSLTLYPYSNGDDLLTALQTIPVDLIFLDIIMPLLNGIDTAKEIRSMGLTVPVIFLTSSREFALDSYDVKAFHYLLKPVNTLKLFSVMDDFFLKLIMFRLKLSSHILQTDSAQLRSMM